MVCLRSLEDMRKNWERNRDSLLRKYSDGYLVIGSVHCSYYKTLNEVYSANPILKEVYQNKKIFFGTLPLLIDVTQELFEERNTRPKKLIN